MVSMVSIYGLKVECLCKNFYGESAVIVCVVRWGVRCAPFDIWRGGMDFFGGGKTFTQGDA